MVGVVVLVVVDLAHQRFTVGVRDLVVVGMDFVEGQEAVAVAAVLRTAWAMTHGQAIENEGAEYCRLAENLVGGNGYRGIVANSGIQLNFPPLYPLLIAIPSLALKSSELAGRLGIRPEQVEAVVQKLLKAKIVSVDEGGFQVPDVGKLRHFLEFLQMKAQYGDLA